MRTCALCRDFDGKICVYYKQPPPSFDFAKKCRQFLLDPDRKEEIVKGCDDCAQNVDGYCVRTDHPDWEYNFVRIKDKPCYKLADKEK